MVNYIVNISIIKAHIDWTHLKLTKNDLKILKLTVQSKNIQLNPILNLIELIKQLRMSSFAHYTQPVSVYWQGVEHPNNLSIQWVNNCLCTFSHKYI